MDRIHPKNKQNIKMKKKEFLEELEEHLIGIPKEDKTEIMQDYEEHFKIGKKKKRTETEISKSLGNPKEIAREIRKELSKTTNKKELKSEAIETWVAIKKFTKHIFNECKDKTEILIHKTKKQIQKKQITQETWIALGILILTILFFPAILILAIILFLSYLIYDFFKKKDKSSLKIILVIIFNIFFFIWIWISALAGIMALFLSSIIIIILGALTISFAIFALIAHQNPLTKNIFFSAIFAGTGIIILGSLLTTLFQKLTKYFFKITKKYIELNTKFIKK